MKTMKYILGIAISATLLLSGCMKEDIDELRAQQAQNAERIAALEEWQQTINSNIGSLQQLVTALQGNDYVTSVTPFESPAPGGYKITFSKSGEATIWNGADGHTPVIAVEKDADDKYYWTLDGDWLLSGGNKVPTTGNTPKVAIGSDGYWYVSADGAATGDPSSGDYTGWTNTGVKATGATGAQGDAIFAAGGVDNTNPDYVVFTLADGETTITLPKYKSIGISFTQPGVFIAGQEYRVAYTSNGTSAPTDIRVTNVPNGWLVSVDKNAGEFVITPPADFTTAEFGKATIWLDEGNKIAAMYNLELHNRSISGNVVGGTYYESGITTGTIYIINDGTPGSGRIVSSISPSGMSWGPNNITTGATSETDGLTNMVVITAITNWKSNYPVFAWVDSKNIIGTTYSSGLTGIWYLPAKDELEALEYSNLVSFSSYRWSSTENTSNITQAWSRDVIGADPNDKSWGYRAYAITQF